MKADRTPVTLAFRTDLAAFAYAFLILFLSILPFLFRISGLRFSKQDIYATFPTSDVIANTGWGSYEFLCKEIYEKSSDVDILFIGASRIWHGIDAPLVQKELSQLTGSKKNVLTLGMGGGWRADCSYFVLKELLARRRVHLIVMQAPGLRISYPDFPHPHCSIWFALRDNDMILGLSPKQVLSSYAQADFLAPRFALNLLRKNQIWTGTTPAEAALGAIISRHSYHAALGDWLKEFQPSPPNIPVLSQQACSNHAKSFSFSNEHLSEYQLLFLRRIFDLLRSYKVSAVFVYFPRIDEAIAAKKLEPPPAFSTSKVEINGMPLDLIQIPNELLFGSLSHKQIELIFCDDDHFNANGSTYFTKTILGSIIHAYEQTTEHK